MSERIPLINIFTAVLFVSITGVITFGLYQASSQMNNNNTHHRRRRGRHHRKHHGGHCGHGNSIDDAERVRVVSKCNAMEEELQALLAHQLVNTDEEHKHMLMEKKHYVKKIKNIVNDLSFNNKEEFEKLYAVLKEIQKDIKDQNGRIGQLERHSSGGSGSGSGDSNMKNELANILIQRMVNDSSRRVLKLKMLDDNEDERVMEKYIIKTIRDEIAREMHKYPTQAQTMNPTAAGELERKMELMDLMNHKLQSMENLYRNLHSNNKQQIITTVRAPVQKSVQSYMGPAKKQHNNNKATTFFVV
jgi:hypothetical protein